MRMLSAPCVVLFVSLLALACQAGCSEGEQRDPPEPELELDAGEPELDADEPEPDAGDPEAGSDEDAGDSDASVEPTCNAEIPWVESSGYRARGPGSRCYVHPCQGHCDVENADAVNLPGVELLIDGVPVATDDFKLTPYDGTGGWWDPSDYLWVELQGEACERAKEAVDWQDPPPPSFPPTFTCNAPYADWPVLRLRYQLCQEAE
jgi:hypothetical protein